MSTQTKPMVKVILSTNGNLIEVNSKNSEYSYFTIKSEEIQFSNGMVFLNEKFAYISGKPETLEKMNLKEGIEIPGKIITKMSLFPQYEGHKGITSKRGNTIYYENIFTQDISINDHWVDENGKVCNNPLLQNVDNKVVTTIPTQNQDLEATKGF